MIYIWKQEFMLTITNAMIVLFVLKPKKIKKNKKILFDVWQYDAHK